MVPDDRFPDLYIAPPAKPALNTHSSIWAEERENARTVGYGPCKFTTFRNRQHPDEIFQLAEPALHGFPGIGFDQFMRRAN